LPRIRAIQPRSTVAELRSRLSALGLGLPTDLKLERIDDLVRDIARTESKRAISSRWENYLFVDRRYKELKLVKRMGNLLTWCVREMGEPLPQPVTSTDFYKVWRLSESDSTHASLAKELLRILTRPRTGRIVPKQVDWKRFHPILCKSGMAYIELKTGRCLSPDQPDIGCYVRCLEILAELPRGLNPPEIIAPMLRWLRMTGARELPSKENDLAAVLLQYDFLWHTAPNWRETRCANRLSRQRQTARDRQRRHRANMKSAA
jgi:hypothetical protein